MSSVNDNILVGVRNLFQHYCSDVANEVATSICKSAHLQLISEFESTESFDEPDERTLLLLVEQILTKLNKPESISIFYALYKKLSKGNLIFNKVNILSFLLKLSSAKYQLMKSNVYPSPDIRIRISKNSKNPTKSFSNGDNSEGGWVSTRAHSTAISRPSTLPTHHSNVSFKRGGDHNHDTGKDIFNSVPQSPVETRTFMKSNQNIPSSTTIGTISYKCGRAFAPNSAVLSDLICSFQGFPGDIIKLDPEGNFFIDPQVEVKQRSMLEGLLEVGYLYNKVLFLNKSLSNLGSVALCVQAAVQQKLTTYYGFIAQLSSQISNEKRGEDTPLGDDEPCLSIRKLRTMMCSPMILLRSLLQALLSIGTTHRGGSIISILALHSYHGDRLSDTMQFLLSFAGKPVKKMIETWIILGELVDPYDEFFITVNPNSDNKDVWNNKFHIRKHLIPNIISESKADMILKCGKNIHFLNIICNKMVSVTGSRLILQQLKDANIESLADDKSELSSLIVSIYEETSALILDTLMNRFKLFQHFHALRKYILLGQGDFATSLCQLLEPELRKPVNELHNYKLTGYLSSAVRTSIAAFEDTDIINRLQFKKMTYSNEDTGNDVYCLTYIMEEPINTAFNLENGGYSVMFNFLWRMKNMNLILTNLVNNKRSIREKINWLSQFIPDVNEVLIIGDTLSMELVHFAKEFECYLQFEVIECVWEKFSESFQKSKLLDDVIAAHHEFITTIQSQTFHDPSSRNFINDLRGICDLVRSLEDLEDRFRSKLIEKIEEKEEELALIEQQGYEFKDLSNTRLKDKEFITYLHSVKAQYSIFIRNYQSIIKKFLLELSTRKDYQLRMLSSRLDYNEYYKKSDSRITDSMKFSRCSDIFADLTA